MVKLVVEQGDNIDKTCYKCYNCNHYLDTDNIVEYEHFHNAYCDTTKWGGDKSYTNQLWIIVRCNNCNEENDLGYHVIPPKLK